MVKKFEMHTDVLDYKAASSHLFCESEREVAFYCFKILCQKFKFLLFG